jgi:molybdopterin synthase sulfur carrier subunit
MSEPTTAVKIRIPTQLRPLAAGASEVGVEAGTVADVLASLESAHPGFKDRLFDDSGSLRRFVNVFVADTDVRFLQGLATPVAGGTTVSIVPAVAGG